MNILHIILSSIILDSSVNHNVRAGCTNAGINVPAAADVRVSAEDFKGGFVFDGSEKTYHEKVAPFTFHLLDKSPEYLADGHCEQLHQKDEGDKRRNDAAKKQTRKVD